MTGGSARVGVDVGGTFTDVVVETGAGELTSTKVLTTGDAPDRAILAGIDTVLADAGVAPAEVAMVIHGTTLATNALIERRGARTALVTTAGFRDVIETRTESRFDQYDLNLVLPPPLIERVDRFAVTERLSAAGEVLVPLDETGAAEVIDRLAAGGYESVAVGFLHSYVDDRHERRFAELVTRRLPDVAVSTSAQVSPQMREFERCNTVCANAYVQPLIAGYLGRLEEALRERGIAGDLLLMHSGGGLMSVADAVRFPVRLVESGPAGGAIFAADLARRHRADGVLSFDMGGTTAKVCLVEDHTPRTAKTFEVARTQRFTRGSGMPISIPVIEMIEIGAGGGSIATVDVMGQVRVGPTSAGSEPGPAAYGRGGTAPTVTDADTVLGRLAADTFGAPGITLDPAAAADALAAGVGETLGDLGGDTGRAAAVAVAEVVDENMASAARVHATENGRDVAGHTMIAFGGAAPLHAARVCAKLGIDRLLVPPGAGVGSAIGFLRAPFAYEAVRSVYQRLDRFDPDTVNATFDALVAEADGFVARGTDAPRTVQRWVSMRYAGQGWEIPVALADGRFDHMSGEQLAVRFEKSYEEFFGRAIDGPPIEAVSWGVRVATAGATGGEVDELPIESARPVTPPSRRDVHDTALGAVVAAGVIERGSLATGDRVVGPVLVIETQTTTWVPTGWTAAVQPDGCLLVVAGSDPMSPEPGAGSAGGFDLDRSGWGSAAGSAPGAGPATGPGSASPSPRADHGDPGVRR